MPKAEVGSTKYIANKMKAKGLQRLRWYCQICEKQCRDENGFKQHTMSEGHVRAMLLVGEDPKKYINDYSSQFKRDFLQLLKTAHGEKKVHMNNFYQEYIRDKEHIHMNATKWPSLTEFAKYLGREGICRVEEGERGLEIQWIDDSPEAIRRREDIRRKDKLAKGDEALEAKMLERQIKLAREEAEKKKATEDTQQPVNDEATDAAPVKVSLALNGKAMPKQQFSAAEKGLDEAVAISTFSSSDQTTQASAPEARIDALHDDEISPVRPESITVVTTPKIALSLGAGKQKAINPLMAKKNPFSKKSHSSAPEPQKKMSNAERIMKEEMERKRLIDQRGFNGNAKRQRLG